MAPAQAGSTALTGLLDGKVGLVTGAGSGIGRVTAQVFAREGAKVVSDPRARSQTLGPLSRCFAVSLTGVWLCLKYEIPAMMRSGGGSIVNISSVSGIKGQVTQAAYAASKGGVIALTKTAAAEYATRGIRVNSVAPGGIETPGMEGYLKAYPEIRETTEKQHAMRRFGKPSEIADAVAYLCSDRSSFITGQILGVEGGIQVNAHDI